MVLAGSVLVGVAIAPGDEDHFLDRTRSIGGQLAGLSEGSPGDVQAIFPWCSGLAGRNLSPKSLTLPPEVPSVT
jgi:hypothetical protein